jgi:hypothetical protein
MSLLHADRRAWRRGLILLAVTTALPTLAAGQAPQLTGDWRLTLKEGGSVSTGLLSFESGDEGLAAFVDGGPVPLSLSDDEISFDIDYRDGGGRFLLRKLEGRIDGLEMSGVLTPPLDAPPGTWSAVKLPAVDTSRLAPAPVDFSGIWSRTSSGTAKVHFDYTPAAAAVVEAYGYLDDPALRCVSPGLVRVSGWPYPLEIVQTPKQVTILYESFHEVRRIWLDRSERPTGVPHRAMGYSLGHWEGSTLVVETELLSAGYVDLFGEPLSEDSRVVERMSLSDDGQMLYSELTLYDPVNYKRPVVRHRSWRKTPDTVILEYDCDPYPFFRGLALEGKLDEYWQRMRQRR